MERSNLASAVRLPNNLFAEEAGTEVGSDLIILQKNSKRGVLSDNEINFIESSPHHNGIVVNKLFHKSDRIVHTHSKIDTDPYGKPAFVFGHSGGVVGTANDLKRMLSEDIKYNIDVELYNAYAHIPRVKPAVEPIVLQSNLFSEHEIVEPQELPQTENEPILTLYDLFGMSEGERSQTNLPKRIKAKSKKDDQKPPIALFDQPYQPELRAESRVKEPLPYEPHQWSGDILEHYKISSLVVGEDGQIGVITDITTKYDSEHAKYMTDKMIF